jgi:hypothetical protein
MLDWFRDNKDAVIAIAALSSPLVAMVGTIIAAVVSFKAVTTGPRVQRDISRDTLRMTQAQITAGLYGAADHQWIVDFRAAIAEVVALGAERMGVLHDTDKSLDMAEYGRALAAASANTRLMLSEADEIEVSQRMVSYIRGVTNEAASEEEIDSATSDLLDKAKEVIHRREARLATYASQGSQ